MAATVILSWLCNTRVTRTIIVSASLTVCAAGVKMGGSGGINASRQTSRNAFIYIYFYMQVLFYYMQVRDNQVLVAMRGRIFSLTSKTHITRDTANGYNINKKGQFYE